MDKQALEKVFKRIEGFKDDMVQLQKDIVPIKAMSPTVGGTGELKKAKFLEGVLKDFCDEIKYYNCPYPGADGDVRPNLVGIIKGKSSEKKFWLMAHMDVVPEGELKLWKTDPWTATVKDGKIYGRGVEDNNQAIVTSIFAMKALKAEGIKPNYDVGLLFVSDEETGNAYGIDWLLANHDIVGKNDLIITPDAGDTKGEQIEVAEKARMWIKVTTNGVQSHAARPDLGRNAHRANAYLICKVDQIAKEYPEKNDMYDHIMTSFEPTKKENNVPNVNTIPGQDIIYFDCRILPEHDKDKFFEKFQKACKEVEKECEVKIDLEQMINVPASYTDPKSPVVQAVMLATKEIHGVNPKPVGIGGGTVASEFRAKGIPAIDYTKLDDTLHQPNEYCVIDNMVWDAKVWAHIALQD